MAKKGGAKPKDKKAKVAVKKEGKKQSALYEISGDTIKRKNMSCPKCGPGVFLGKHKDRVVCGKCGYAEYSSKE
jgi:ubiquitin-small subunit ribosomal protein S27Ae